MTFRVLVKQEFPFDVDNCYMGGVLNCPCSYGYEEVEDGLCFTTECTINEVTDEFCRRCWDREIKLNTKNKK